MMLQGICDDRGRFIDVFVGLPRHVHDANRMIFSLTSTESVHLILGRAFKCRDYFVNVYLLLH